MGYTVYFGLKEIRYYNDETIAEMNKTFARSYRKELSRLEKITGTPFNSIRDDFWSDSTYERAKLYIQHFHEDATDCCFIYRGINYIKTSERIYDIAIKKAILAVQRKFNNPLEAYCDDGFIYDKNGITLTGIGLEDEFVPIKPIRIKFADIPLTYQNKNGETFTVGTYNWIGYA